MRFLILLIALSTTSVLACGGPKLTEGSVRSSSLVSDWKTKFEAKVDQSLTLKEVVFAGNEILNIDMVPVASAMCNANFIYAYFRNQDGTVVCALNMESSHSGLRVRDSALYAGNCRLSDHSMINFSKR